ncbi:red-like protein [Grosmannia clavigera kw1407]|uniref:Red-like protein n=1 Tax=Grosmannia clavigera (strain kw1407 / UAMH 11150) TaxID=655863 RepID=F0XD23_GROCL|nr:red-like protein [Grosmannia clavigera kw1407]EFX03794.1 red-like protein [Grosmannia clavigera kw1407]
MNNDQFRRLALGAGKQGGPKDEAGKTSASPSPGILGSRQKSSIPMTPRSGGNVSRVAFARQMAERFQDTEKQKKVRTSVPKGSRLAQGYVDRAKTRVGEDSTDEREQRLAALQEALKLEQIDQATYDRLQLEIAGGDLSSTHLVKGLDFKLLERVRRGEDVFGEEVKATKDEEQKSGSEDGEPAGAAKPGDNIDDEFERLVEDKVQTITHEKVKKKGQLATTRLVPGQKRTRDQILAEMKAAREAAKKKELPALGSRFKRISAPQKAGSRIEHDSQGREVLIIVDEDGHEKRKVRKLARGTDAREAKERERQREAMAPAEGAEVLGMEVPEFYRKQQEAEAAAAAAAAAKPVDIFEDADADYDPLAGMGSDSDSDSDSNSEAKVQTEARTETKATSSRSPSRDKEEGEASDSSQDAKNKRLASKEKTQPTQPRQSYFKGSTLLSEVSRSGPSMDDPAVVSALRKAKAMREAAESEEKSKEDERTERLKKLLQASDRDAEDLDMGFGTNRVEDDEDMEESDIKLSTWGDEGKGEDGQSRGEKGKRKRGAKKRKGDGNNAADVMRVLERRKGAGGA